MTEPAEWDQYAATFDDEPDHGLGDPAVRAAWAALLLPLMPRPCARVADLGCGTGSLSVLLATHGHRVRGLDLSAAMIEVATGKAAGLDVELRQGDASDPPYPAGTFDVVLARHVLWALPDPGAALARWVGLLAPGGRLVLVEGHWYTGAGLPSAECEALVRRHLRDVRVTPLPDPALWGRAVADERYLVVGRRPAASRAGAPGAS